MTEAVQGLAALQKQLRTLATMDNGEALLKAARAAAEPVLVKARDLIPVGVDQHKTYKGRVVAPGFAKRSIRIAARLSKDRKSASASVGVEPEAFYAVQFVELGTAKMAAQPWLTPAYESTREQQLALLNRQLKVFIERPNRRRK